MNSLTTGKYALRAAVCVALISVLGSAVASGPRIVVTLRGHELTFSPGLKPYRSQTTVMVPFRETATLVGAKVVSDPDGKHLALTFGKDTVTYEPGHHGYRLNGHHQNMWASSEMRTKRLFVPIRLFTDLTAGRVHAEIQ